MGVFLPDLRVEVAFNAGVRTPAASRVWTDISDYVELDRGVTITGGRADERAVCEANTLALVLDNSDGRFTPERAASPHYPNVKVGRPIRVRANHLTAGNRGTFALDATGWSGTSCTVARVTTPTHVGAGALSMTATAAADITANAAAAGAGDSIAPGETYTAEAWVRRNGVTARDSDLLIEWYDVGGALLSTINGNPNTTLTTSYQLVTVSGVAPATAAFARARVRVLAAAIGEVFHADSVALFSDRFFGFVDEWPVEWDDGTDATASSPLAASSRLSLLGEGTEMRSVVEEEYDLDVPVARYTLGEPAGATSAADSSGDHRSPLRMAGSGTAVTFGSATGPGTDGLTAATLTDNGRWLQVSLTPPAGDWTVECFFSAATLSGFARLIGFGAISANAEDASEMSLEGPVDLAGVLVDVDDGSTRHLAIRWTDSTNLAELLLDGVVVASITEATATHDGLLLVGNGAPDGVTDVNWTPPAVFAHVAVYHSALSTARLADHAAAGLTGTVDELAAARLVRYAAFGDIPAAEVFSSAGVVPLSHIDTTGKTLVDAMRVVETTDGGVLFDGRDGSLRYQDREARFQAPSSFTIDAAAQQLDTGVRPVLDRSAILNDVTVKTLDGTVSSRVVDAASILDHGRKGVEVDVATNDETEPFQAASRRVNLYADPRVRVPSLAPVDILPLGDAMIAKLLGADVGTRFAVTGQPSQAATASADYFVEGYVDTIGPESWHRSFNVSAAALSSAWLLDSATLSQLDTTTVLG